MIRGRAFPRGNIWSNSISGDKDEECWVWGERERWTVVHFPGGRGKRAGTGVGGRVRGGGGGKGNGHRAFQSPQSTRIRKMFGADVTYAAAKRNFASFVSSSAKRSCGKNVRLTPINITINIELLIIYIID